MTVKSEILIQSNFYRSYSAIRKNFRKYSATEIINYCIRYLGQRDQTGIEYLELHPWLALLLLKWAILDENNCRSKNVLTAEKFQKLMRLMFDLRDKVSLPSSASDAALFFRLIAYQQFIYQEEIKFSHVARQYFYFETLNDNHFIKRTFLLETKIPISCFLDLSIVMASRFMNKNFINPSYFSFLSSKYTEEQIKNFLALFTRDNKSVRNHLNKFNNGARSIDEIYEQTYLTNFPLIKFENAYVCAERHTLWRCIEHFIYDFMKRWNAQKFMNQFGLIFESAVEESIKNSGLSYYVEAQIRECFKKGKFVDFIITEKSSNVFIESKSVEMAYQGKVSNLTSVVEDKSRSIIEAIEQAFDLVSNIKSSTNLKYPIDKRKQSYLIVVTYKDFYLGN